MTNNIKINKLIGKIDESGVTDGFLESSEHLIANLEEDVKLIGSIDTNDLLKGILSPSENLIGKVHGDSAINVKIISSGPSGKDGLDAYEMWLDKGNIGSLDDFFNSLKGSDGFNYIHPDKHSADMIVETEEKQFLSKSEKEQVLQTYIHNQRESSFEWQILHNLDKYPSVSIVDTADNVVSGNIEYISKNELVIYFTSEFSGKAYLN